MASDLARQIVEGEGLHTEFKSDARSVDGIARTVCAFLNSQGGTIFCGVSDDRKIAGLENADDDRRLLETQLQREISPRALFTVGVELVSGRPVLVIEVPEGKDRPYVYQGAAYIRQGSLTRAADARTLRSLIQGEAAEVDRWERRPSPSLEFDDLDDNEIARTVEEAHSAGRFSFEDGSRQAVLQRLSMLTPTGLTNAADVAFANAPEQRLPQCRIRMIRFASEKSGDTFLMDRWFAGPVVRAFEAAYAAITEQVPVQSYFPAGRVHREDRPLYAFDALREGLVNAVAHRDYSAFSGGVTVSIYPGRIEIWNSGRLPVELRPSDLKQIHPSIPNNPDISHVLYLRRLMERIGRGTQKIIAASKELGAPTPKWTDRPSGVTLTLFAARGEGSGAAALNMRQLDLLRSLKAGDRVLPIDYEQTFAGVISGRQARRDLSQLEAAGLLVRRGAARATYYERTDRDL